MKNKWKRLHHNSILRGDGFFISFNPDTSNIIGMGSLWAGSSREETALVIEDSKGKHHNKFLILDGDFRKEYEPLVEKGLDACVKFFEQNRRAASAWSDV